MRPVHGTVRRALAAPADRPPEPRAMMDTMTGVYHDPAPARSPDWRPAHLAGSRHGTVMGWWRAHHPWAVPGLVMALAGALGIGTPGMWADELATWGMTQVTLPAMDAVLRYLDAVLGPYYTLVFAWSRLAGSSDLALRLPSLAAMAAAAALVGATGARLAGPRTGLLAGLVFAALPGTSRFAQEARPYALGVCAATLATYLLVRLLEQPRPRARWLVGYAGAVAAVGLCHVVGLLLLVAHGAIVAARDRRARGASGASPAAASEDQARRALPRWAAAALAGVLPSVPLLVLGWQQRSQIAWIAHTPNPVKDYVVAGFGTAAVAVAVALLVLAGRPWRDPGPLLLAWAVLPVLALGLLSLAVPLMLPRYLLFTLPAWALLAGLGLARVHPVRAGAVLLCTLLLALPAQLAVRTGAGHLDATRELAAVITAGYRPGDGIVYAEDDAAVGPGWEPRDAIAHYVPADRRPRDLFALAPQRTGHYLLAQESTDLAGRLGSTPRVWIVRLRAVDDPVAGLGTAKEALIRGRYRPAGQWHLAPFTVALMVTG